MKQASAQYARRLLLGLAVGTCALWPSSCGRHTDQGRELVNASGLSKDEVIRVLRSGADVNKRSSSTFGWTPLISAIYHHKEEVVDLLLAYGADVNLGDDTNQTPLLWAIEVWGENANLIQKLIQQGADPRIRNRHGSDAFDKARSQRNAAQILELLPKADHQNRKQTPSGRDVTGSR